MSLAVVRRVAEIRDEVSRARRSGMSIGMVPTMGALHAGHGALIDRARAETSCVVVSIFVNPLQFDRKEDYERYARTLPGDLEFCRERGADLVTIPRLGLTSTNQELSPTSETVKGKRPPPMFRTKTVSAGSLRSSRNELGKRSSSGWRSSRRWPPI